MVRTYKLYKLTTAEYVSSESPEYIRITFPFNTYPLIHDFDIVKLGYAGVWLLFLFVL